MNETKKLTDEQFHKFSDEFRNDLRTSLNDIVKDMENHLSYLKDDEAIDHTIQSALLSMVSMELCMLLAVYKPETRPELMKGLFMRMACAAETIGDQMKKEANDE